MEEVEIWREIPQFNGKYLASNLGRIKSIPYKGFRHGRATEKILSTAKRSRDGYALINLITPEGIRKTYQVHRLVAITFIDGYKEGLLVNHKNEIKDDNRVDNLEWCTVAYNVEYSGNLEKVRLKSGMNQKNNKLSKSIGKYTIEEELIEVYPSLREAERLTNIPHANISKCALGKAKTAGGYKWKYEE